MSQMALISNLTSYLSIFRPAPLFSSYSPSGALERARGHGGQVPGEPDHGPGRVP